SSISSTSRANNSAATTTSSTTRPDSGSSTPVTPQASTMLATGQPGVIGDARAAKEATSAMLWPPVHLMLPAATSSEEWCALCTLAIAARATFALRAMQLWPLLCALAAVALQKDGEEAQREAAEAAQQVLLQQQRSGLEQLLGDVARRRPAWRDPSQAAASSAAAAAARSQPRDSARRSATRIAFTAGCQIHVFWDLDNVVPSLLPVQWLTAAIRRLLGPVGEVASFTAYGNAVTFRRWRALGLEAEVATTDPPDASRASGTGRREGQQASQEEWDEEGDADLALLDNCALSRFLKQAGVQVRITPCHDQAVDDAILLDIVRHIERLQREQPTVPQPPQQSTPCIVTHCICIVSNDLGYATALQAAAQAGLGAIAVCNQEMLGTVQPGIPRLEKVNELLKNARADWYQRDGKDSLRACIHRRFAQHISDRGDQVVAGTYPGAHITLDYRAVQARAAGVVELTNTGVALGGLPD
ncbi:hypothetical protein V8C86DRAFT_2666249, partial [Haematococcus lacustris]